MHALARSPRWPLVAALTVLAAACSSRPDSRSAGANETAAPPPAAVASTDSASSAAATRGAAPTASPNADRAFLRAMSDHQKGTILIAHETLERKKSGAVHDEAQALDKTHDEEVDRLHTALRGFFQDDYTATATPEDQAAVDSLVKHTGTVYDRAFRQAVIAQDEQGVALIDRYLPTLTRADVKTLAERMRASLMQEIDAFKGRLGAD